MVEGRHLVTAWFSHLALKKLEMHVYYAYQRYQPIVCCPETNTLKMDEKS